MLKKNSVFHLIGLRIVLALLMFAPLAQLCHAGDKLDIDSLEMVLESLSGSRSNIGRDTTMVEVLNLLCWTYRLSDPTKAKEYGKQSLELAKNIEVRSTKGWTFGIAKCLSNLGIVYEFEGNIQKAIEYYNQSIELYRELGNDEGVANNLNNLGAVSFYQGDYNQAIDYWYRALKIQEELGNIHGVANCLNNLGHVYRRQGDTEKAIELYVRSMEIDEEAGNKEGLAHSLNNLGNVYKGLGDFTKATDYYQKSLKLKQETGNKSGIASTLNNLGLVYAEQNNFKKAMSAYNQSLAIENELGNQMGIAISLANIGELYLVKGMTNSSKGDIKIGIDNLMQGLGIIDGAGDKYLMHILYENLATAHRELGDFEKAYEYYVLFSELKDNLFNEEKSKDIGK
ncbi:MAG: tetratricopeptide repeat protein, partial [Flavobacteriales bacterium]|nr:tetratricopeptide repeat protein [Flavobacteriales bacterium]